MNAFEWLGLLFIFMGAFIVALGVVRGFDAYLLIAGLVDLLAGGGIYSYGARNRPEAVRATPLSQPDEE